MAEENIGEMYFAIKADATRLRADLESLKAEVTRKALPIEKQLNFKARFDAGIAKLRLSELQNYHKRLQLEFAKKISLNVDAASLDRTRQKIASVEAQLSGVGKTAQSMGRQIAGGLLAFGGITALFRVLRGSIEAAKESAVAQAQISQAVRTTGQSAGFTAKQLFKMAEELQRLNAVDDDTVLTNITNNLLTFKNVSGNAFKRAQQAILDLNAVISKGEVGALTSQTIQLGKALNDPIQGISALTRVGISFTNQQKEQVKSLADSGKLLEAQSLILTEIEGQYGGQAAALANATGGLQQFSVAIGNLLEKLGAPFLTVFSKAATYISLLLNPIDNVSEGFLEQKNNLDALQKSITPLLARYDELKSKTSLNKDEQDELRSIILRVADAIPSAISSLDDYGTATDINRTKIEEFIKTEQKRLAVVNKGDIEAFKKKKNLAEQNKKLLEGELKRSLESGKKTVQFSTAQGVIEREVKISDQDIKEAQQKLKAFQDEIDGYNAQLDLLSGKVNDVTPTNKDTVVFDTTAGDEVLKQYEDQQQAIEQINNKLKDVTLTDKQRGELQKALNGLLKDQKDNIVTTTYKSKIEGLKDSPGSVKPLMLDVDEGALERMQKKYDETMELVKLKKGELVLNMQETDQVILDNSMFTTQAIFDDWVAKNEAIKESIDDLTQAFTQGFFQQIRISSEKANSMLEQGFVAMANAFIAQVERMIAEWLAFQAIKLGFGLLLAPVTGGASAVVAAAAHSGGEFLGTSTGIKKMAAGGSLIIPPGFPNDSYPMLVESGERVTVNPKNQVGIESRLLQSIDRKLTILNSNTIEGQVRNSEPKAIPLYGKIENDAIYISNKRASKLIGRMG